MLKSKGCPSTGMTNKYPYHVEFVQRKAFLCATPHSRPELDRGSSPNPQWLQPLSRSPPSHEKTAGLERSRLETSGFGFHGIHRGATDDLAHFAGLFRQR